MSNFNTHGLSLTVGLLLLCTLIFIVPLLSRNVAYRAGTLFGGLNAGIVVTSLLLDDWSTGGFDIEEINKFLLASLPRLYISSIIVGAVIIPKYVLLAPTQGRAIIFGFLGVTAYYFLSLAIPNVTGFLFYIYANGPLPSQILLEYFIHMLTRIVRFEWFFTTVMIVSALVSMVATSAIIQKSEDLAP